MEKKLHERNWRAAFYVVWKGRAPGVKFRWLDCVRSIANFEQAQYKGYRTLAEAYAAYDRD